MKLFRKQLLAWYRGAQRDLPWRRTGDPYRIWLSEIMLQQTRVAAVIPYFEKFVARFPDLQALAQAPESKVLAQWAGLGYYSRARNLHKAAKQLAGRPFPSTLEGIRALAGVGEYTASAVASIAFGLPHAAVDGNVLRVMARLANDAGDIGSAGVRSRLADAAQRMLDTSRPGEWNQAVMELGATVCLPRNPECARCPVSRHCAALGAGTQNQLPVRVRPGKREELELTLLIVEKANRILMRQRSADAGQLAGFWELPDTASMPVYECKARLGSFSHQITFRRYVCTVIEAGMNRKPKGFAWIPMADLPSLPLSTTARKALALRSEQNDR